MSRCLTSMALLFAVTLLVGCAEESLDSPIIVPEESQSATVVEDTDTNAETVAAPEIEEPEPQTAVGSVWNALFKGTAEAMDESGSEP